MSKISITEKLELIINQCEKSGFRITCFYLGEASLRKLFHETMERTNFQAHDNKSWEDIIGGSYKGVVIKYGFTFKGYEIRIEVEV